MPGIYYSKSKGPTDIDTMPHRHIQNAIGVCEREGGREEELAALRERASQLRLEYRISLTQEQGNPETTPERLAEIAVELARLDEEDQA